MMNLDNINDMDLALSILKNEEELIIKPFHSSKSMQEYPYDCIVF